MEGNWVVVAAAKDNRGNGDNIFAAVDLDSGFFDFAEDVDIYTVSSKDKKGINDLKSSISDILSRI